MSSSGNKETEERSEVQSTLEDGGLHRGGVVGDLSRGFNRSVIASGRLANARTTIAQIFNAYSAKCVEGKFLEVRRCGGVLQGILSLPNVWLEHRLTGGPYEESGRIGVRVAGRRGGIA